ncbi:hypothetical protein DPMN_059719 [Dreissena polymorpha]|uniref:Uncharacterized protein n=1 Tax=Dreissena polymorpha TaxID=45954 RepID=A0A9D4C4N2_DREPO|nr:hypothetical protein DPMN_059719 [Dreissena polymorpha]
MPQLGCGQNNVHVQHLVEEYAEHLGKLPTNKPLGINWLYCFPKRWKYWLSTIKPSTFDSGGAKNQRQKSLKATYKTSGQYWKSKL